MNNTDALRRLRDEIESDGAMDSPANVLDLLDYLAIIGVDGASDCYSLCISMKAASSGIAIKAPRMAKA